jgi:hypothetical protein
VFHVKRNSGICETATAESVRRRLGALLPPAWILDDIQKAYTGKRTGQRGASLRLRAPDGQTLELRLEVKDGLEPRAVRPLAEKLRGAAPAIPVVVAPHLGRRTRELLVEEGIGFADGTGNFRIAAERPTLFIQTSGSDRDPDPVERPLRSLRGPGAGRAIRALCDFRPPYGVRDLAARSGASAPTLSRVISLLEREALLERGPDRSVARADVAGCLRRWASDYSFADSNRVSTWIAPRGLPAFWAEFTRWSKKRLGYAATGSAAVNDLLSVAPARLAQAYVTHADPIASRLGLRPAEAGANVALAEPFDNVVFARARKRDGLPCAALPQVAVDLLTSPGRGPEEGEELLRWMAKHEGVWRA